MDSSVPVPSNIIAKSITWGTITLSWDSVKWGSFYQIKVDGSMSWDTSSITNTFTKRDLPPDTEHNFRVRVVCENRVSEWSEVVRKNTLSEAGFFYVYMERVSW